MVSALFLCPKQGSTVLPNTWCWGRCFVRILTSQHSPCLVRNKQTHEGETMAENTETTTQENTSESKPEVKTFTQEYVDRIVQERLARSNLTFSSHGARPLVGHHVAETSRKR